MTWFAALLVAAALILSLSSCDNIIFGDYLTIEVTNNTGQDLKCGSSAVGFYSVNRGETRTVYGEEGNHLVVKDNSLSPTNQSWTLENYFGRYTRVTLTSISYSGTLYYNQQ